MRKTVSNVMILICAFFGFLFCGCSSGDSADCREDTDCPPGYFCRNQECDYDCTSDADCPSDMLCTARGRCQEGCTRTNGGVETCDGLDNDCDGDTDEGLLNRCGECLPPDDQLVELCGDLLDNDCDDSTDEGFEELGGICQNQGCQGEWVCSPDRLTLVCDAPDPASDDSSCDGLDDDCDGQTDEDVQPLACPLQDGVCRDAVETCLTDGVWSGCNYGPLFSEGIDDVCDQQDNDCDGDTDEDAQVVLVPETGEQAADGLDNNCNGLVDEAGGVMVPLPTYSSVWIDAFEISVFASPDCTGIRYGAGVDDYPAGWPTQGTASETLYACSLPGVIPSGYLSWFRAKWACEAQGKQLCTVPWWGDSCTGGMLRYYPYGLDLVEGVCNDPMQGSGGVTITGDYPECTSGAGSYDMSGNLAEWVVEWSGEHQGCALTGGFHYACEMCEAGTNCRPCDLDNPSDYTEISAGLNCVVAGTLYESFKVIESRPYLGTRCCLEITTGKQ